MPTTYTRQTAGGNLLVPTDVANHTDINAIYDSLEKLERGFDAVAAKTADYTATADDIVLTFDCTGGARTLTLPAGAGLNIGKAYWVKKIDVGALALTIDGNGSETIDGELTAVLYGRVGVTIVWDGTSWFVAQGRGYVNPARLDLRWFGTNLAAFTAALAAAAGKTLYLGPGTFAADLVSLAPASGTVVEGAGEAATILQSPASPTLPVFDLDAKTNVTLRGFSLAIPSGTASSNGIGIRMRGACSGVVIEDVTADGFVNGVRIAGNEGSTSTADAVQTVTIGGTPTGGTFTLGLYPPTGGDFQETGNLDRNITAADLRTALEGLAFIDAGNVAVSGSNPAWTLTFQSSLAGRFVPLLVATSLLTGGTNRNIVVEEVTRGGAPWVMRTTLRRVRALNSPTEFGFRFDDVDDLILDGCRASGNALDGVKGRRFCHNLQILGGDYSRNGQNFHHATSPDGGDGIDLYVGGEFTRIIGATLNENLGNGLQIKNDDGGAGAANLSGYGSGAFGLTRKLEIVGVHACRNSWGSGILIDEAGDTAANSYSVSHTSIIGGLFEGNQTNGLLIKSGRDIGLSHAKAVRNGIRGIEIQANVTGVDIDGCMGIANGWNASSGIGLYIAGDQVRVRGGRYFGTWDDGILDSTDRTALTKYHSANIFVVAGATDVKIDPDVMHGDSTGSSIQNNQTGPWYETGRRLMQGWVADDIQNPSLGTLPAETYVSAVHVHVTQAFDSDGTDTLTIGYDADPDAFATSVDVSTTGVKTVTLGVLAGYNGTARAVEAYYVNGGSEPTLGKAFVMLEYAPVAPQVT